MGVQPNFHSLIYVEPAYNSGVVRIMRIIDELDAKILDLLQQNARITQADIAKAVGLAPSAVLERIRKLDAKGVIREYTASVDPHVVDLSLLAFVSVRTSEYGPEQPSAQALAAIPEVLEVHHVAGDDCYLLKVRARDAEHLGQLLRQQIATVPHVTSTRTTVVLGTTKETTRLPLGPRKQTLSRAS
jgi:Lrp/AsnC family transcriptional regulator, leucine-responsive regulatory protein